MSTPAEIADLLEAQIKRQIQGGVVEEFREGGKQTRIAPLDAQLDALRQLREMSADNASGFRRGIPVE